MPGGTLKSGLGQNWRKNAPQAFPSALPETEGSFGVRNGGEKKGLLGQNRSTASPLSPKKKCILHKMLEIGVKCLTLENEI